MTLSVIIITHNEAAMIQDCLESVHFADEIIVVDSGSDDDTVGICRRYTDKVTVTSDWPGFGVQKQRALDKVTGNWVLSLDADERVTPACRQAIEAAITAPKVDHYRIRFQSYFLGKAICHGDWRNEYHMRLFKRGSAKFDDMPLHENLIVSGQSGVIEAPITHYSYQNWEEVLDKLQRYSTAGAKRRAQEGRTATPLKAIGRAWWAFQRHYWLKLGCLDGWAGFWLGVYIAHYTLYRYLKLWWLTRCC